MWEGDNRIAGSKIKRKKKKRQTEKKTGEREKGRDKTGKEDNCARSLVGVCSLSSGRM